MECDGLGFCLSQCECSCADCCKCKLLISECECECNCDIETECNCLDYIVREICTCGHREHNGMCKPEKKCQYNCEPKLCPNDKNHDVFNKGSLHPEWVFACHGKNCYYCGLIYGHGFIHTNKNEECPVCYENKLMISLRCKHNLCWDCWSTICKSEKNIRSTCPLCRTKKW